MVIVLMRNSNRAVYAALFFVLLSLSTLSSVLAFEKQPLTFVAASGRHVFTIEVAVSPQEQMQGLMYRQSLGANEGMIFVYPRDQEIAMWMKNTYISLDMIFVRSDGSILRIERSTEPFSERVINSGDKARAVIEVKAGTADRLGLKPGDKVEYSAFR